MGLIEIVSFALLCIFGISYIGKLIILSKKNNIKANVFGKGTKSKESLIIERFLKAMTFAGIGIWTIVFMKTSWRAGIDKSTKTSLITSGLYRFSRNPAFVGMDLMFIGAAITYANLIIVIVGLLVVVGIHLQILQEENHMEEVFKKEYSEYVNKTPRYLLF